MTPEEQLKQLQQQLEIVKTQKEIADLQAGMQQKPAEVQQAIAQAESAAAVARKATLEATVPKGESKPREGAVTTDEKFGYMATLVAYQVMCEGAATVARAINDKLPASRPANILIVDERNMAQGDMPLLQVERQFDFFSSQLDAQYEQMDSLLEEMVAAFPPTTGAAGLEVLEPGTGEGQLEVFPAVGIAPLVMAAPALLSSVADIIGYFKTDYAVTGQTVDLSGEALLAEVAGRIAGHAVRIFNFNLVQQSVLVTRWAGLIEQKLKLGKITGSLKQQLVEPLAARISTTPAEIAAIQTELDKLGSSSDADHLDALRTQLNARRQTLQTSQGLLARGQAAIANADTLAQAFSEFMTSLTTTSDPAVPPLWLQAAVRQQIRQQGITHLLYLKIVSSGGEAITKKSFWSSGQTSYLGGAVITYLLAAVDGTIELAGSEVCLGQLDHQYSKPTATVLRTVPVG